MISIIKQPYSCCLTKNNIDFEVKSNMYFDAIEVAPSMDLVVDSFPGLGTHYRIEFYNPETGKKEFVRLVVSSDWSTPGTIPYFPFTGSVEPMVDQIVLKLKNYKSFNAWYTVTKIGIDTVRIVARFPNVDLTPIVFTNQTSLHFVYTIDKTTVEPTTRIGYQLKALVYFENDYQSGDFEMVSAIDMFLDENAKSRIDISSILDAEIESNWNSYPLPLKEEAGYVAANLKRYYIDFVESWSGEPDQRTKQSDILFAHWGGVSTDDQQLANPLYLNTNDNRFLTWWPSGKKVGLNQPDWLSWMNQSSEETFTFNVKIYTDAGETTEVLHSQKLNTWETFVFQTGYSQNDLESFVPGEYIRKWEYFVKDSGNKLVSPYFRYFAERFNCFRKVFIYFNSDGMPETFNTSGEWVESVNISSTIATRSENFNLNRLYPQSFVFNSKNQSSFKAATGPLTNLESSRLLPMINSMVAYVYDKSRWVPVIMTTQKADVIVENEFIRRISIQLSKANVSDRASYHEVMPDLIPVEDCGITQFIVEDNNLELSSYGQMKLYRGSTFIENINWNAIDEAYIPSSAIIVPGEYRITGTIGIYSVNRHFNYSRKRMSAINDQTGLVEIKLRSINASETIYIDWGDGNGFTAHVYTNSVTTISHTYTVTGKKEIIIEKACFDDIDYIGTTGTSLSKLNVSELNNLKDFVFVDSIGDNVYLSANSKIETINLYNSPVFAIGLGFQKNITTIGLGGLSLSPESLDDLFLELWKYRKYYSNTPTVNITTLGFTPSALVTSIIDGTGEYAGQGLVTNYSWTISIS